MKRRDFLGQAAGCAAALSLVPTLPEISFASTLVSDQATLAAQAAKEGLSILQGLTTATTTQLTVDVDRELEVTYKLFDVATKRAIDASALKSVTYGSSSTRVDRLKFTTLELGHTYRLEVRDKKKNGLIDERFLKPVDLNKHGAKIGVMSCMNDSGSSKTRERIWASAEKANLDYMLFIGDAVYGDLWIIYGPSYLWSRYVETRKNVPYYRWKNLKPVLGTWDDHDFGKNNAGGDYKHKNHAYHTFKTFFAQEPEGQTLLMGWGNSTYFQAFNQNIVLYDCRFYRGETNADRSKAFFGHKQINWMSEVVAARSKPTLLLQGSPMFGRVEKKASYDYHAPEEFDYFLKKARSWNSPVLLGGGDLHFSEVSKVDRSVLGYETYELISSCMHSNTKSKFYDNPNPRVNGFLKENFLVLQQNGLKGDGAWNLKCLAQDLQMPFEMNLKVG